MPRPISWLPRLHEISRRVAHSVRSHYDRHDLEQLFELQPRAAQKLLELLPTLQVGTSRLVGREVLAGFLDQVRDADDTAALFEQIKVAKAAVSRKKPRALVRRDRDPVSTTSLPQSIALSRGRIEISFQTVEQLAEDLFKLAQLLTDDVEEFARTFEPELPPPPEIADARDIRDLFAELERLEQAHGIGFPSTKE